MSLKFSLDNWQIDCWQPVHVTCDHVTRDTCAGRDHDVDDKENISKKSFGLTGPLITSALQTSKQTWNVQKTNLKLALFCYAGCIKIHK